MSTSVVGDIYTAVKAQVASTLGATYVEMRRIFNPADNDLRTVALAYGVKQLSASPASGVTRVYTLDHGFEILLMKRFVDRDNDSDKQASINTLFDRAHAIFVALVNTKVGLPAAVLNVEQLSFPEPEILDNQVVLIRAQFVVKYRQSLT